MNKNFLAFLSLVLLGSNELVAMEAQKLEQELFTVIIQGWPNLPQRVRSLIDAGADRLVQLRDNETPLHEAATVGKAEVIELLLTYVPEDKLQRTKSSIMATLLSLLQRGLPRDIRILMTQYLISDLVDEQMTIAKKLLTTGNKKGQTPLQVAQITHKIMGVAEPMNLLRTYMDDENLLRKKIEANIRKRLFPPVT